MASWIRRWWWALAVVALVLFALFRYGGNVPASLLRRLSRARLEGHIARLKADRKEAEKIRALNSLVREKEAEVGKRAVVEVEKLAKTPDALVEAYKSRLEHLRSLAEKRDRI